MTFISIEMTVFLLPLLTEINKILDETTLRIKPKSTLLENHYRVAVKVNQTVTQTIIRDEKIRLLRYNFPLPNF